MPAVGTADLVPVLQTAVSPVVLISGVGLLLLTMTNRLGRIVDRARSLALRLKRSRRRRGKGAPPGAAAHPQPAGGFVRRSIALAAFCVLFAALLVISLFVTSLSAPTSPGCRPRSSSSACFASSPRWWSSSATSTGPSRPPRSRSARTGRK